MKYSYLLFIFLLVCFSGCRTKKTVSEALPGTQPSVSTDSASGEFDYYEQTSWLLGYFNPSQMKSEPHSTWYFKGYDEYMPESAELNKLLDLPKDDLSIKIVMGSWCPDSRREVPRFMKILDTWQFPAEKIVFIGADINKVSPVGEFDQLNIERVPTFIIYKNNIEAGRIIEVPQTSLEQDLVNILTGMNNNE